VSVAAVAAFDPAAPGYVLMQADYSQAELRVMAALGNDVWLIDIFADPTVDVFEQMLPMAFPHRVPRNAEEKKEMRALLKGVIYGLAFGRQAKAIAHALGMHPAEAQRIIDNFLGAATGLAGWRESVFKRLHSGEGLRTRHGRYFQNDVITPRNKAAVERSALSFEPQSSASDCCVLAAIELFQWIEDNKKPWFLMALVHDSITLDVPEDQAEEASEVTRAMLVKHGQAVFPEVVFAADGGWGKTWDQTG
jgi:DNA polymerase-1